MGPYGRGLRLHPKSKGYYIIIAAGTGILPFIDLFHFLLQKTLLWLIQEMVGEEIAKKLNEEKV
jgi:NAD(P)H-flavin reductase